MRVCSVGMLLKINVKYHKKMLAYIKVKKAKNASCDFLIYKNNEFNV